MEIMTIQVRESACLQAQILASAIRRWPVACAGGPPHGESRKLSPA